MAVRSAFLNTRARIAPLAHLRFSINHNHLNSGLFQYFFTKPSGLSPLHRFASSISRTFSSRSVRKAESGSPFVHALRAASEVQLINSSMNGFYSFSSHAQKEQFQHCVMLVDAQGAKVGSMSLSQAVAQASAAGKLHLSVVAASAVPPIVKLVSADSVIAHESKKNAVDKESRSKKTLEKEIQMMMNIAPNDIQVKVAKILDFCHKGCRVKLVLRLKRKEAESDESHAAAAAFLADFCSTVSSEGISSDGSPIRNFSNYSVTLFKKTRT